MPFTNSVASGCALAFAVLAMAIAPPAASEENEAAPPNAASPTSGGDTSSPAVGLDALLRLPNAPLPSAQPGASGTDRERWQARFAQVRTELAESRAGLAAAQNELESMARDYESWQMAAPGAKHDPETSPISHKLRNDIRERREDIARAERRLRELEVEASLAGVPAEWRRAPVEDASPGS
jgi:hypothetical protein